MELKEELVLIDGNSLINRAYYALPLLTAKDGNFQPAAPVAADELTAALEQMH